MNEIEKDEELNWRVGKSMEGTCKLCNKFCKNLTEHKRQKHSERSNICPLCETKVNPENMTRHIHEIHPIQIGIMPFNDFQRPGTCSLSGKDLKSKMEGYGMNTKDVIPYKYFAVSFNHEVNCYRWVAYSVSKGLLDSGLGRSRPPATYKYCKKLGGSQPNSFTLNHLSSRIEHGHGAPARLYRGDPKAYKESCLFANISAQRLGFNNGLMAASECHERTLAETNELVIVLTGPTYNKDSVGWEDAGCGFSHFIPEGFFKIYIIQNKGQPDQYQSFHLPNSPDRSQLFWYKKSIPEIQALVDYVLLPMLHNVTYTWDRKEKTRFCKICKKAVFENEYTKHKKDHTAAFTCYHENCFKTFASKNEYEEHRGIHRSQKYKCDLCPYVGFGIGELKVHQETHAKDNLYFCDECPASYKHEKDLLYHKNQLHSMIKNYYCPIDNCNEGFPSTLHLDNHIVRHHGKKQFYCHLPKCADPPHRFWRRIQLREHFRKFHWMSDAQVDEAAKEQTLKNAVDNVLRENLVDPLQLLQISNFKREIAKGEAEHDIFNMSNSSSKIFNRFDKNDDQLLDLEEFKDLCETLFRNESVAYSLEDWMVDQMFQIFDLNKDGFISAEEFETCHKNWIRPIVNPVSVLVVVDVQNDFISGSLALKNFPAGQDGKGVIGPINKMLKTIIFKKILYTREWHPKTHISFIENLSKFALHKSCPTQNPKDVKVLDTVIFAATDDGHPIEQRLWPKHCIQNTRGSKLDPELKIVSGSPTIFIGNQFDVDSYSAFFNNDKTLTPLKEYIDKVGAKDVYVCGLAYDARVGATALDSLDLGFRTILVEDAIAMMDVEGAEKMRSNVLALGGIITDTDKVKNMVTGIDRRPELGLFLANNCSKRT